MRCAIGKANILISGRFKQFSTLIDDCVNGTEGRTRVTDLQGFWEMIYYQVQDVVGLFESLKNPQVKIVEEPLKAKKKIIKKTKVAGPKKSNSGLKAHIMAKRKEMQKTEEPSIIVQPCENKVFDGGFFKIKSPSPMVGLLTPSGYNSKSHPSSARNTLDAHQARKSVLLEAAVKRLAASCDRSTPFAVMRVSTAIRKSLSPHVIRSELDYEV